MRWIYIDNWMILVVCIIFNVLIQVHFEIFLWINPLIMYHPDLRDRRVWLKLLYFDQVYSRKQLLNKLSNHFILFQLFYLQNFNKRGHFKICLSFHLLYLDDLARSEREELLFHFFLPLHLGVAYTRQFCRNFYSTSYLKVH